MEEQSIILPSGAKIPCITSEVANQKNLLSRTILDKLHLMPTSDPVAYGINVNGERIYYFHPDRVTESPIECWYDEDKPTKHMTLPSGSKIPMMSTKRAQNCSFYSKEQLDTLGYDVVEEPTAYYQRKNGGIVYFYDKKRAIRRPLMCVNCGKEIRYKHKLCKECFLKDTEERRIVGDQYRSQSFHMKREKVIFFDLELTGVYNHDEVLSVSITDGTGKIIMDTLVKPERKRKWPETEEIHGITPQMVENSPLLRDISNQIRKVFDDADVIIGYGVATDYNHIRWIYKTAEEREKLHKKILCAYMEYNRYLSEHFPEEKHNSLIDAMENLQISWDGIAHTSIADTIACAKVWEKLFPNYYDN